MGTTSERVETVAKAGGTRAEIWERITNVAKDERPDLPVPLAIETTLRRWPELERAYRAAPLAKSAVQKAEATRGHEYAELIRKDGGDPWNDPALAMAASKYYAAQGDSRSATRYAKRAEALVTPRGTPGYL
jgi:hypothetical protein